MQGVQEGRVQGVQEGLERGSLQQAREDILCILRARLGPVPDAVEEAVRRVSDLAVLSRLLESAATTASLRDFEQTLGA
ncbi:MAG: hypothetical protein HY321_13520 [Armatimonadetes bacterium]|nr:hypothetical protein [Armatimonadota bacterium]